MGGDTYPTVRVAAVQAAPVFLDRGTQWRRPVVSSGKPPPVEPE